MKNKKIILVVGIIVLLFIVILGIVLIINLNNEEKESYEVITISGYSITINEKYQYEYLDSEAYGIFNNDLFYTSYIFITSKSYNDLIYDASYYTDMFADEIDSTIEEMNFGSYSGFIDIKQVNYSDTGKDSYLNIIIIQLEEDKSLVIQYEIEDDNNIDVLNDIKNNLIITKI